MGRLARAAIEAMREPDDAMDDAGNLLLDADLDRDESAANVWRAMIDAALKESRPK